MKIPSHPYILVNRSVLCNCEIEADNHYVLESIATCDNKDSNLIMYFTINMIFTNYLNMLRNLTNVLSLIKDRTTYEQLLPINLRIPPFDSSLKHAPTNLKHFMHIYAKNKEIFDLKQRHVSTVESLNNSNKNFFFNNYIVDIFVFTSSIISLISTTLVIYLFHKHKHIRTLVVTFLHYRKSRLCKGYKFSNAVKIMLFVD